MPDSRKYDIILDALQQLLEENNIQTISVSDIAQKAGIGKGSIYYYFPSKDAILDALIERSYEKPLQTAKYPALYAHGNAFSSVSELLCCFYQPKWKFCQLYQRAGSCFFASKIPKPCYFRIKTRFNRNYKTGN